MKRNWNFVFVMIVFLFCVPCFAQEAETVTQQEETELQEEKPASSETQLTESEKDYIDQQNMSVTEVEELIESQSVLHHFDFIFGIEPQVSINTHIKNGEGKFISAPSPMSFPVYLGLAIPNYTAVSFQPSLRFFTTFNLVYDDMVLPAEIENRTGLTFSFLVNLPVAFKINIHNKYSIDILAGVAGLIRFATPPVNVKETEPGYTGTVKTDVDYMNSWFYKNARFLYLSVAADWLFYYGTTKYGPELSIFFPISVFSDKSLDGMMFGVGVKVELN